MRRIEAICLLLVVQTLGGYSAFGQSNGCSIPAGDFVGRIVGANTKEPYYGNRCAVNTTRPPLIQVQSMQCLPRYCCEEPCTCDNPNIKDQYIKCSNGSAPRILQCFVLNIGYETTLYGCCPGSEEDQFHACAKIVDCSVNNGGCDQVCSRNDTSGKDYCSCYPGYQRQLTNSDGTVQCTGNGPTPARPVLIQSSTSTSTSTTPTTTTTTTPATTTTPTTTTTTTTPTTTTVAMTTTTMITPAAVVVYSAFPVPYIIALVVGLFLLLCLLLLLLLLLLCCRRKKQAARKDSQQVFIAASASDLKSALSDDDVKVIIVDEKVKVVDDEKVKGEVKGDLDKNRYSENVYVDEPVAWKKQAMNGEHNAGYDGIYEEIKA